MKSEKSIERSLFIFHFSFFIFHFNKMALFSDINDLKTHIGGTYTASVKLASIAPFIEDAVRDNIEPRIGSETVDILRGDNLAGKQAIAAGVFKSAVAWFAVADYLAFGSVVMTENGLMRVETDTYKTVFKYQDTRFDKNAVRKAYSNLEFLLKILSENGSDFIAYTGSDEKALNTSHFLNFTTDFRNCESRVPDRLTLESLLPYISDIETFMVEPFLGDTLYMHLKGRQYVSDETNLTKFHAEKILIKLLRQGIAAFTFHLATVGNVIQFDGNRVIVKERQGNDDFEVSKTPSFDLLTANFNQKRDYARRYFQRAEMFMRDNAAYFTDWVGFTEGVDEGVPMEKPFTVNRLKSM